MDQVHQSVFQPHMIAEGLRRNANRSVIVTAEGAELTGRQVAAQISRHVQALSQLGISRGCRVALLSSNRAEVLYLTSAAMFGEVVYLALHPLGSIDDDLYVLEDASVDVVIAEPRFLERVRAIRERASASVRFLSFGPCDELDDFLAVADAQLPGELSPPVLEEGDVFRLAYSGGTTGKPKAIQVTHGAINLVTTIQLSEWEWPRHIRQLLCAPLSHSGATLFVPTLVRDGTVFIQNKFEPATVIRAIENHKINCMLLVPTMIYSLLDHPDFDRHDLSSIETIFYGASPMSVARLQEGIRRLGPVFFQFYGQAEAPMSVTVMRRHEHLIDDPNRLASCGRPVPYVHVRLMDADGTEVPDGTPGEICVRGPLVMPGYLNEPDLTDQAFSFGWLHTGDIAVRDQDGFIRIVDRSKDMIITGGFNVYPREVEDALGSHPSVASACVYGMPDPRWGEIVIASVVLRDRVHVSVEELMLHVRKLKGPHQAPKRIEFLDALPLSAVGKPNKKVLRERALANMDAGK